MQPDLDVDHFVGLGGGDGHGEDADPVVEEGVVFVAEVGLDVPGLTCRALLDGWLRGSAPYW